MKKIVGLGWSLIIALVAAFTLSSFTSLDMGAATMVTTGASVATSFVPSQKGIMPVVFLKEAFVSELKEAVQLIVNSSFLKNAQNLSGLVDNDVIKWNKIGAMPDVLVGPVSFPLTPVPREDDKDQISLIPYRTVPTSIPVEELHALPYDKKSTVFAKHKLAISQEFLKRTLHSFAPDGNTNNTPLFETTGGDDGTGRRRMTMADLINYAAKLKTLGVVNPDLVLSASHVADLQLTDQAFAMQYHNIASGKIINMYGFNIMQDIGYNPVYDNSTLQKKAYGAVGAVDDRDASVVIVKGQSFYAQGSLTIFYDEPETTWQEHRISELSYNCSGLFEAKGSSAIISGRV